MLQYAVLCSNTRYYGMQALAWCRGASQGDKIRRARIQEDKEWKLLKPGQTWSDGDVTSPVELETIEEDELGEYIKLPEVRRLIGCSVVSVRLFLLLLELASIDGFELGFLAR